MNNSKKKLTPPSLPGLHPRDANPKSLTVVVPCYNEEEVIYELEKRLTEALLPIDIPDKEVLLVDDGSRDRTWQMIGEIIERNMLFKAIRLSRNHGHQLALSCGLSYAAGDVVLIMDADLQDPPELLSEMLSKWRQGYDVIYGKRTKRQGETASKKFFAYAFYRTIAKLTGIYIPEDSGDFRLMDKRALNALNAMNERHRFIRGMVSWIGFNQTPVYYERPERFAGVTKYPFRKSLKLAIDAITSFSTVPLRFASYLGICLSFLAFVYIIIVISLKVIGVNIPGYTSLMASILLLGGVQLIVLGIIGEYVGRIFEQGQGRPLFLIDNFKGQPLLQDKKK
jgi:polyisoprenyl-phosphate glycosyltransferase